MISFLKLCSSAFSNNALTFQSPLGMRQLANAIAQDCPEISFGKSNE